MGGQDRLAEHHGNKVDARTRLEHVLDKGSFREFGTRSSAATLRPTESWPGPD